jgi:DNA-binding beta-propeller fold protein YncE
MRLRSTLARFAQIVFSISVAGASDPIQLPTGLWITPDAAPHSVTTALNPGLFSRPNLTLGQAVTTALSPDGTQLLVLTSGYNKNGQGAATESNEYVFVYDVTSYPPRQVQALPLRNSFCGLAWNPNGLEFYASGGVDDTMYVFARKGLAYSRAASIALGHPRGNGLYSNAPVPANSSAPKPMAAGIGVNQSGTIAVVANFYNDSISVIDLKARKKSAELDLRPGVQDRSNPRLGVWASR